MQLTYRLLCALPDDLKRAKILGGGDHPPTEDVKLNGPPGTGKTTQIALRLAYLIEKEDIEASEMTVVTYRTDLSDAVKRTLTEWGYLDEDDDLEFWSTMHAASNRATGLLGGNAREDKQSSGNLGNAMGFREQAYYCSEKHRDIRFFPPANREWESTRGQTLMDLFNYAQANLIDLTDPDDVRHCPQYEELMELWPGVDIQAEWEQYEAFKSERGWYDFNELLEAALDGPLPPTDVVVVDEYHDVTPLMAAVAERWFDHADIAIAAGDPLQVVNEYAGSHPRYFTDRLDMPEILLDTTYRVGREHWQAAIQPLRKEFSEPSVERVGRSSIKTYNSPEISPPKGSRGKFTTPSSEIEGSPGWLYDTFVDSVTDDEDRSMLLLARTRKWARGISIALDRDGIIHGGQSNPNGWGWDDHRLAVFNALKKLESVPASHGTNGTGDVTQYCNDAAARGTVSVDFTPSEIGELLDHANARTLQIDRDTAEQLAREYRNDEHGTGDLDDLDDLVTPAFWQRYTNGAASVDKLTKADLIDHDVTALKRALSRYDDTVESTHDVRSLTIHASKGAEASDVAVFDGITGKISREMDTKDTARQNEARTWYVALSRASERLHVMYNAFPAAIDHLPHNLAERASAAAKREANGGDTQ